MDLSVKHSLPPLPGRTLLVYLTDADADKLCPKSNPQGVKNIKGRAGGGRILGILRSVPGSPKQALETEVNEMHLLPSIRPWFLQTILE